MFNIFKKNKYSSECPNLPSCGVCKWDGFWHWGEEECCHPSNIEKYYTHRGSNIRTIKPQSEINKNNKYQMFEFVDRGEATARRAAYY